jgi:hypothetical protein
MEDSTNGVADAAPALERKDLRLRVANGVVSGGSR